MTSIRKREENKEIRFSRFQKRIEKKRKRMIYTNRVVCLVLFLMAVALILTI